MTLPCEPDPERLFSLFLTLAKIDSVSRREGRVSRYVTDLFRGMGYVPREDDAWRGTGGECGNLVVRIPAEGDYPGEPLILNAHMDTVEPGEGVVPVENGVRFSSMGDTVLGADDKAGVAAILSAVEAMKKSRCGHRALEVVLTVQEELGLAGIQELDFSALEGRHAVVLDGSGDIGGIVSEAPTRWKVTLTVNGRSAHAGIEPEKGINAIACAARAISRLELGRLDGGTTVNIGVIVGGRATNIVPDRVVVQGEVRSLSDERLSEERRRVSTVFEDAARDCGCTLEINEERSFQRFEIDTGSRHVRLITRAMAECGIEPFFITSGGGSDANVLNEKGVEAVNLNMGFHNAHSERELICKDDLFAGARLLIAIATDDSEEAVAP